MATQKTEKQVNYTAEQTAELVAAYKAGATDHDSGAPIVAAFAEKFGKPEKSIKAKLTREGVYFAKVYKTKAGTAPVGKEDLASEIANFVGLSDGEADSVAKANKTALAKILTALKASVEPVEANEGEAVSE